MKTGASSGEAERLSLVHPIEGATDESSVGGKAWNLARMQALGVCVPPGFVVTDAAFQAFLDGAGLRQKIRALRAGLRPDDPAALRRASATICSLVREASLPPAVSEALLTRRPDLADGGLLIVRSSAVGEDSGNASFAGQLDSFPDVGSAAELERALQGCWASCWSERSLHYQHARGVTIDRMGVVVQRQVDPKAAGVLFTLSPDQAAGATEMIVEYCPGHGEKLVSGRVNPGRISMARDSFRYRHLADPELPEGEAASGDLLDETSLLALHRIGLLLEHEFLGPQDIEWALDHTGTMHIVQARPVTTPLTGRERSAHAAAAASVPLTVWSNANINENYPDPVSPFLYSVATDGYYHYFRNLARAFGISSGRIRAMDPLLRNVIGAHGARLYYNLTNIHGAIRMAPFGDHLTESFNIFVGAAERTAATTGAESFRNRRGGRLARLTEGAWIFAKTGAQFLLLERGVAAFERTVDEHAALTHPENLVRMPLVELHAALQSFLDIRCNRWTGAGLADAAAMIGYGLLRRLVGSAFTSAEESTLHNRLLRGLQDLVSAKPVNELWLLSRRVREDPALRELFSASDDRSVWQRLKAEERFSAFAGEVQSYLERWGFRCSGELMLTVKSFQEDPAMVVSLLKGYAALGGESPAAALEVQARERGEETRRVCRALSANKLLGVLPWPHGGTVAGLVLRRTQQAIALRERARLKQSLLYSRCRRVMLRIGEELAARGVLPSAEDVFFLTHQEIDALLSGRSLFPCSCGALVALRRKEHEKLSGMAPPDSMALPRDSYFVERADPAPGGRTAARQDGEALSGTGACGGTATGRAAVLTDVSESGRLEPGDILVTRQTDPGWAPLFFLVRGLVMERGGMLSHGAIIAREYGIPTVVGVRGATSRIRSGQTVAIDGDAGRVQLVG